MTPPIRLDDLERDEQARSGGTAAGTTGTATRPAPKFPRAIDLDSLEAAQPAPAAPATPAAPAPAGGDIDLRTTTAPPPDQNVAPRPAPGAGRGTFSSIVDALGSIGGNMRGGYGAGFGANVAGPARDQEETRTFAPITDYATHRDTRTPAERTAAVQDDPRMGARADVAAVRPSGSPQAAADQALTSAGLAQAADDRARFTPEGWRDVARRGMAYTNTLYADAQRLKEAGDERGYVLKMREADRAGRQSYNAQLLSENIASADTKEAIALSALVGTIHDPNAPSRTLLNEAAADPSITFTPGEQATKLGKNLPVPASRSFDAGDPRDLAIPMAGSLPLFAMGDAVVADAAKAGVSALGGLAAGEIGPEIGGARGLLARGLGTLAEHEPEADHALDALRGLDGTQARVGAFGRALPGKVGAGAMQGQVTGAVMAAREAQQHGEDVTPAVVSSILGNAVLGGVGGALLPAAGLAVGETRNLLTTGLQNMAVEAAQEGSPRLARSLYRLSEDAIERADPRVGAQPHTVDTAPATPLAPEIAKPVEAVRAEAGKLPLADQTPDGQHATIAKALDEVMRQKEDAATFGSESGTILRDPSYLSPIPDHAEPDVPLRSAADVARERAGMEPVDPQRPSEAVDAVRQMERQSREEARVAEERRVADEQARIEQAAQQRASEKQGPLTLAQTIARAGREREAGEPLAAEYHKAISDFASVDARVKDAGESVGAKLQLDYDRAKVALNEARKKYGVQAGGAAIVALASANSNLTDDEKKMVGLGGLAIAGSTAVVRAIPEELRGAALKVIRDGDTGPRTNWLEHLATSGVHLGEHYSEVNRALHEAAMQAGGPDAEIPAEAVRAIFEQAQPIVTGKFVSRLGRTVEQLQGKAWDNPRPAADWIGKLKGLSTFSKSEYALIEPFLQGAQSEKVKLSRADVLGMVDKTVPQIERHTLMHPDAAELSLRGDAGNGDADEIIPIDDLTPEHGREELQQQIDNREAAIARIESEMEDRQSDAADAVEHADRMSAQRVRELRNTIADHFPDVDVDAAIEPAIEYIDDHVDSEHIPRGTVEKAMQKMMEEGDFPAAVEEPREPEEFGLEVDGDDESGWTVTGRPDEVFHGATREEALAAAEHAGAYKSGSDEPLLPKGMQVEETEGPLDTQRRFRLTRPDGTVHEGTIGDRTFEEAQRMATSLHGEGTTLEEVPVVGPHPKIVVLKSEHGQVLWKGEPGETRAEVIANYAHDRFSPPDHDAAWGNIDRDLHDYAEARSEYQRAESEHYWMTEGEAFDEEHSEIDTHRDEIGQIESLMQDAPEQRGLAGPEAQPLLANPDVPAPDPLTAPVRPKITGKPRFDSYQRIGGGTNYRELTNVWANNPGEAYTGGHWNEADTASHIRVEDHTLPTTPGLTGAKVDYFPDEPEAARLLRSQIDEARQKRTTIETQMTAAVREYEALPAVERDSGGNARANELATQYRTLTNQVKTLADRESELISRLNLAIDHREPATPVAVMIESQSDLAQDATKYGVRREKTPEETRAYLAASDAITVRREAVESQLNIARRERVQARDAWREIQQERQGVHDPIEDYDPDIYKEGMESPSYKMLMDHLRTEPRSAELIELTHQFANARTREHTLSDQRDAIQREQSALDAEHNVGNNRQSVPPGPFTETRTAQALNVARFLLDSADRGYDHIAWSDGANRVTKAHLPIVAARLTYDEIVPSVMKSLLNAVGFKNVAVEHTFIRGFGHWKIDLTPEMRAAIRKNGLPILGVLAALALPQDAEAEDTHGAGPKTLYGTALGGIAVGGLLVAMAGNRKLRALVKENSELRAAVMIDDLSGLANKKAHRLAIESVNRDARTSWVAFDANRFKTLNDTYGHPMGDRAIQHFGEVIRDAAKTLDIPMRGFRPGGDEFAFAVPKGREAAFIKTVEESSPFIMRGDGQPEVTTSLTGAFGDTWDQADTQLTTTKAAARLLDPSLNRVAGVPDLPALFAPAPEASTSRSLDLHANPVGPALALLKKYPSPAGLAIVGTLMATESDNENIRRAGVPVMALAALSAIGSARIMDGAGYLGTKLVAEMRKVPEGAAAVRAFNPDALLTPEVRAAIRTFERDRARGAARATEFSGKAKALGPVGDRAVSDVLENESWEDTASLNAKQTTDVLAVAAELQTEYADLTAKQVAAGTLHQKRVLENYGGPRQYAYYDAMDALAERPSAGARGNGAGSTARIRATKARTLDVPIREAEAALAEARAGGDATKIADAESALGEAHAVQQARRVDLGEIREASYRAAIGIEQAHNNIASAKLFETLRNVPGAAHPEWQRAIGEFMAARDLVKTAATPADKATAEAMRDAAFVEVNDITRRFKQKGGDYVSLPETPSLGVLSGAVVTRDIAHSLEGFGTPGTYGKFLRAWKEMKTVFNPGTSVGNILSNVVALHMGDVPVWLQPRYYTKAARDLKTYGEATRALAEAGVLNVNSVNALGTGEIGRGMRTAEGLDELLPTTRPETARVLRQSGVTEHAIAMKQWRSRAKGLAAGAALGGLKTADSEDPTATATGALVGAGLGALAAGRLGKLARRVYDNEDNIARLAVFLRRRALGDTVEQARDRAIASLGDFRSRSPALRVIASTVSPFVMYQAKAVPAFARNVVDHPWKYMTLIAAWGAANELGKQEQGEVPESDIPSTLRRTYGYFFPGFTQLPLGDEQGNKGAVDMSRWTPMSGVTTGAPPGSVPEAFGDNSSALVTPGGPVIDAALQASNVDPFTHDPLLKRDRPLGENVSNVAHRVADFALPSAFGFHAGRLKEDMTNEDWTKLKNDLLGPTGVKPRYVRPGAVRQDATFTLERDLRDMKQEYKQALRANKDPERVAVLAEQYKRRVATALANYKTRVGTPPADAVHDYLRDDP